MLLLINGKAQLQESVLTRVGGSLGTLDESVQHVLFCN